MLLLMHLIFQRHHAELAIRALALLDVPQMLLFEMLVQVTRRARLMQADGEWCLLIAQAHQT